MNIKTTFPIYLLLLFCIQVNGQSLKKQFNELLSKNDTLGQKQLLEKWEKADSIDPELYVAYFNYFANKSKKEIMRLDNNSKGKDGFEIKDKDTTKKDPVAYLYSDTYFDLDILIKGFEYIDKGIKMYPNRLDMRFGKIYMFGQVEDYEKFTIEIIKTVEYSSKNNNNWTWTNSKPIDNPKEYFLSSLQGYQLKLYNTKNDDLLENMKRIAESILNFYPEHIESLSNLSIVYMLQEQYEKALVPLLKAEKINPKDAIVLNNIAQAYKLKGDRKKAIQYYNLVKKYGNDDDKQYAEKQIDELK